MYSLFRPCAPLCLPQEHKSDWSVVLSEYLQFYISGHDRYFEDSLFRKSQNLQGFIKRFVFPCVSETIMQGNCLSASVSHQQSNSGHSAE